MPSPHPLTAIWPPFALAFTAASAYPQTAATLVGDLFMTLPAMSSLTPLSLLTSAGTGFTRTVQTNDTGQYRITPLNPGTYSLSG